MVEGRRWIGRRNPVGAQTSVLLVMAVALVSVVTGIANIGTTTVFGPLGEHVPAEIQQLAGFTGALTGFLMLASALGLRRGLRAAWYTTVVLLPVTAGQGLVQSSQLSFPLVVLSTIALPVVLVNYRRFDREVTLTTSQLASAIALSGVLVYGTVGTYALREGFSGVSTVLDAFYYTIVTASTVGYGDVTATTQTAKLFSISVVTIGTASFAIALGALLGPAIEARLTKALGKMTESQLELLENHVLVLGYGELTEPLLSELDDSVVEYVVIAPRSERTQALRDRGVHVINEDPSDEESLERAQLADARAVIAATNSDGDDALSVLTARQLRPNVRIVAAATDRENVEKLRRAGADTVISPATIGSHLLAQSALGEGDTEAIANRLLEEE
ncbi:potassium channel protein [Halostella sp. JP-L12]|uniref:NAD-binding protein n=1 Tax=Halostella TaxID=1843185 RepID=UPI000EF82507|nr:MULTISPECIES: NAD-binding protein [Halostella]NHN47019.1 potassium channel protein [Halostella sp. JP-L12]